MARWRRGKGKELDVPVDQRQSEVYRVHVGLITTEYRFDAVHV
jgi:hypothetical protein